MAQTGLISAKTNDFSITYIIPTRQVPSLTNDVYQGLLSRPRSLPPKYFYDDRGSQLFEKITETEEYYPTRLEDTLLTLHGEDIIRYSLPSQIIEFGSGSSRKTRRLFDACEKQARFCKYAPFDVCKTAINQAVIKLTNEYKWLDVTPLIGDYHAGLMNIPAYDGTRLFVFIGSTIGNFTPEQASAFTNEVTDCMKPGDYFLIGADRVKNPAILNAAYNDSQGITAEFNLNVLRVLNRKLDADFDVNNFDHAAVFNEQLNRIEMSLISTMEQKINLKKIDEILKLDTGEKILTELSYKFRPKQIHTLLTESGLQPVRHYQPLNNYYSLVLSKLPE